MTGQSPSFWHWPSRRRLAETLALGSAMSAWFAFVFAGADYVTGLHSFRVQVHLPFEPRLPLVPPLVAVYLSIYLLFWLAPFLVRRRRELAALVGTMAAVTACAGVCFLVLPAADVFPPPGEMGIWTGPVRFAKTVALRNNFVPSLHVALSVVCVAVYAGHAGRLGRLLLWAWSAAIAASTLLLHQHYLIDVVTGYALGLAGVRWAYERWAAATSPVPAVAAEGPVSARQPQEAGRPEPSGTSGGCRSAR